MARVTRVALSVPAANSGVPVKVTPTATAGETIHTATTKKDNGFDSVTLHANNSHTAAVDLSLEIFNGTTVAETMLVSLAAKTAVKDILKDFILMEGYSIRAFASVADVVHLYGHCDQTETHATNPAYLA